MTVARSNFQVSTPSGWIVFTGPNGYKTLHISGKTFIGRLQAVLRASSQLLVPARTYDGTTIRGTEVGVDGKWGEKTYRALWAFLSGSGSTSPILEAVQRSAQARIVPLQVMEIA